MQIVTRILSVVGLVLVLPVAWGLARGDLAAADAGIRAVVVLGGVVVARWALPKAVLAFADTLDGSWRGDPPALEAVAADDDDAARR